MKLYTLDANYTTLTGAVAADIVPKVRLPADLLEKGGVLRGRLTGKKSKAEGPETARFQASISPTNWSLNGPYKVGDVVQSDGFKQYRCSGPAEWQALTVYKVGDTVRGAYDRVYVCSTAGTSGATMPSGIKSLLDGTVVWDYIDLLDIEAYWSLNDGTGATVALDNSGHGRHLTTLTNLSWGTGLGGRSCLSWADRSVARSAYGTQINANGWTAFSISLWASLTLAPTGSTWLFFWGIPGVEGVGLYNDTTATGCLKQLWCRAGGSEYPSSILNVFDSTLRHFVLTFDLPTLTWSFYREGSLVKSTTLTAAPVMPNKRLVLGNYTNPGVDGWVGLIDDVRLYSRVISATEVAALYSSPETLPPVLPVASTGPTGRSKNIRAHDKTWDYEREVPVLLDTREMTLDEGEHLNVPWSLEFEIHVRPSRKATGLVLKTWHGTVVTTGVYQAGDLPKPILLPEDGPAAVDIEVGQDNVLNLVYTPTTESSSITCMTYVLEAL